MKELVADFLLDDADEIIPPGYPRETKQDLSS